MADIPMTPAARMRERAAHEVDEWCRTMTLEASATFAGKPDKMAVAEAMVASIRLLAADIRALPLEDEWQPIETVPTDGKTHVLISPSVVSGVPFAVVCPKPHGLTPARIRAHGVKWWRPIPAPPKGGE